MESMARNMRHPYIPSTTVLGDNITVCAAPIEKCVARNNRHLYGCEPKYGLGTPLFVVACKDILASSPYNFNHGQTFTSAIPDGAISSSSAPNDVDGQSLATDYSARSSSASQGENERICGVLLNRNVWSCKFHWITVMRFVDNPRHAYPQRACARVTVVVLCVSVSSRSSCFRARLHLQTTIVAGFS